MVDERETTKVQKEIKSVTFTLVPYIFYYGTYILGR
jgi:hypothetical protein